MAQHGFSLSNLKEYYERRDTNELLSCLLALKKHVRGAKNINDVDRETYEILINLIKYPNAKIMNISMSILANCCVKNDYRELFKELGGIPHIVLIVKTIDNNEIFCRACRLVGNLANNYDLASTLNEYKTGIFLLKSLETVDDKSSDTLIMILRAVKKLWVVEKNQLNMLPEEVCNSLNNCLNSADETVVIQSIETLTLFSTVKGNEKRMGVRLSKELLANLVALSKKGKMTDLTVKCLSHLICYQTSQVWKYLEGSGIPEVFIRYIQNVEGTNKVVFEAFYKLCTEGAVRNKVKSARLFPKLMKLVHETNNDCILMTFCLFQYDLSSIGILARDKEFISLLIRNITKRGSVRLLGVLSRLDPPTKELISPENLNIIINNKECHGVLKKISQSKKLLGPLITSGRIWEISRENCLFADEGQYAEGILVHLLRTGDKEEIENAALAVPFLVKPRHFTFYKILARNNGITIILRLLKEKTLEERILATIVKLINIFQDKFFYKHSEGFYDDSLASAKNVSHPRNQMEEDISEENVAATVESKDADEESVVFELDCGTCFKANKNLLCKHSPVLNAMLNGYFIESNQPKVKLSCCTADALKHLELLLANKINPLDISIETYLELISLTDRFLMMDLSDLLTVTLPVDQSSCVAVLQWCRNSGYTKNNGIIRKKVYDFVFSSSSNLLVAMKNDTLRTSLVEEISNYLSTSFMDLL